MKPKTLILTGYGLNTDYELQHAFRLAGAEAERVHLNDLIDGRCRLMDYDILALPGGFAFADDLGGGKVLAQRINTHLLEDLLRFIEDERLVFSTCNGFQVLAKLGLLPRLSSKREQEVTLTFNDSGKFENRWVYLKANQSSPSVFTKNIEKMYLPVRHGEGKFVVRDDNVLNSLKANEQIVLTYCDENGNPAGYPYNPNGSVADIAGVCDPTGRIFGLMPHPEAYLYKYNHPRWTRGDVPEEGMGLQIFQNAVEYVNAGVGV